MSRSDAEVRLKRAGASAGLFLCRRSTRNNAVVMSLCGSGGEIHHLQIKDQNGVPVVEMHGQRLSANIRHYKAYHPGDTYPSSVLLY